MPLRSSRQGRGSMSSRSPRPSRNAASSRSVRPGSSQGQVRVSRGRSSTTATSARKGPSTRRTGVAKEAERYSRDSYSRSRRKGKIRSNFNTVSSGNRNAAGYREVRVSDVQGAAQRRQRKQFHVPRALIALLVAVAVLVGGGVALYNTDIFPVKQVAVTGATHVSAEEVTALAAVPEGSTLLRVDTEGIANRLKTNPWIESVSVDRSFPDTVNLNITERSIGAVVEVAIDDADHTENWALSTDGIWLCQIPDDPESEEGQKVMPAVYEDAQSVLKISGVPYGQRPEVGEACNSGNVSNALSIVSGMSTELSEQVKTVSATSSESTTITLQNGVEIAFGDASDIREKERVCLELMKEHEGQIAYINVRVVGKPIWRSL